jgi:hypothetical protein
LGEVFIRISKLTECGLDDPRFNFRQGQGVFIFSETTKIDFRHLAVSSAWVPRLAAGSNGTGT